MNRRLGQRRSLKITLLTGCLATMGCSEEGRRDLPPPEQSPVGIVQPSMGDMVLIDRQTGSTFNLRGEAIAGPLSESNFRLEQLATVNMFWFAWRSFFPEGEVWTQPGAQPATQLPEDKTGAQGCEGGIDCAPSLPHVGPPSGALAWTRAGADDAQYLRDSDIVLGTVYDQRPRAYPYNVLAWHEMANDRIGDLYYSVSLCPLTGSAVVWGNNEGIRSLGVSGNLLNFNLVMYDHASESLWPQLWMGAASGPNEGRWLNRLPSTETTWANWKKMYPDTLVLSDNTGFSFNYRTTPFRRFDGERPTVGLDAPIPLGLYPSKSMVLGLIDRPANVARGYSFIDLLREGGERVALNETFNAEPVVVVFEESSQTALAFVAKGPSGQTLIFDVAAYTP
ncbi:MAG: DUF3179 domain-containing (seleno)protein [Myxococcota bacterium]